MEFNKKDKLIDSLAEMYMHFSSEKYEKTSRCAILVCFILKFTFASGVYILFRNFVSSAVAELWMAIVMAYALYGHELYISTKVKESLIKTLLAKNIKDEKTHEEDTAGKNIDESEES